jgi:predicted permease
MLLVALAVIASTALGVAAEHRFAGAPGVARLSLSTMLYGLVPFVSYVSFAHLHLSLGGGIGLVVAYAGLAVAGTLVWLGGRRLGLDRPALGGLICSVILVNTGYLGLPMCVVLIGGGSLSHAVAYDQVVSGPMVFTVGFAVGAAFGTRGAGRPLQRLKVFLTRNPPLLAAVAGLLVPASLAPHPLVVASHVVVDALLVLGFFVVGVNLSAERREDGARLLQPPDRAVALAVLCRFAVNPLLLLAVSAAGVGLPSAYLLQASMPTGINSLVVGHAFGLDQRVIATVIVWTTIVVLVVASAAYVL